MNKCFVNIRADLDLKRHSDIPTSANGILERFHCYQSILKIQEAFNTPYKFFFREVREDKV